MNMFDSLRFHIENSPLYSPHLWLLPPKVEFEGEGVPFTLIALVDETRDVLER